MDEHVDVGSVATASEPAESVTFPRNGKTLDGGGSFCGGDGEEIMVEVVGSDVFVDGVGVGGHGDGGGEALAEDLRKENIEDGIRLFGDRGVRVRGLVGQKEGDLGREWDGGTVAEVEDFPDTAAKLPNEQARDDVSEGVEFREGPSGGQIPAVAEGVVVKVSEVITSAKLVVHGDQKCVQSADRVGGRISELGEGARKLGNKVAGECSSLVEESSSVQTQVSAEGIPILVKGEVLDCKDELPGGNDPSSSEDDQSLKFEVIEKNGPCQANAECSDQPAEVDFQEESEVLNKEEMVDSKVEGMEVDASDQVVQPVEYQEMKVETGCESAASHGNIDTVSRSMRKMTNTVTGGEVVAADNVSATSFIEAPKNVDCGAAGCNVEEVCADPTTHIEQIQEAADYSGSRENNISASECKIYVSGEAQVFRSENGEVATTNGNFKSSKDQELMAKSMDDCPKTDASVCTEPESFSSSNQVANDIEVETMDDKISIPKLAVSTTKDDLEGSPSHTGRGEDLKVENADVSSENKVAQGHHEAFVKVALASDLVDAPAVDGEELTTFEGEAELQVDESLVSSNKDLHALEVDENVKAAICEETVLVGEETVAMDDKKETECRIEVLQGHTYSEINQEVIALRSENTVNENVLADAESSGKQTETRVHVELLNTDCQRTVEAPVCIEPTDGLAAGDIVCKDPPETAQIGDQHPSVDQIISDPLEEKTNEDKKEETITQLAETLAHEVDRGQSTGPLNVMEVSNKGTSVAALSVSIGEATAGSESASTSLSNTAPCRGEDGDQNRSNDVSDVVTPREIANLGIEGSEESGKASEPHDMEYIQEVKASNVSQEVEVDDHDPDCQQFDPHGVLEMEIDEYATEIDIKSGSYEGVSPFNYLLPPADEGEFSVSDLVWGKVRSHPWWPGQIFDPVNASEKAIKYHKKDSYLVAYFGDRTFAWNDASLLKPFRSHFSQIEKQSNSEVFHNAVDSALEEVSRRVELGLSCSCIAENEYDRIGSQIVENTGIREESSRRYGVDESTGVSYFEPCKLIEYVRALAHAPSAAGSRLEVVIAKAQLLAYSRFKQYRHPPEFQFCGDLVENEAENSELSELVEHSTPAFEDSESIHEKDESELSHKRKHCSKDDMYPRKKERSLSELMGDMPYSPEDEDGTDGKVLDKSVPSSSGKKRIAVDFITEGADKRVNFYAARVSSAVPPSPKPSFKVGDCIRRAASQLTGSPSILKNSSELDVSLQASDYSALDQILLQLHLAARDPMKGFSFLNNITDFFSGFRNSVSLSQNSVKQMGRPGSGRKRKGSSQGAVGCSEDFEFDDVNDSYWTDRIVQNYSEQQLLQNGENGEEEYQMMPCEADKSSKSSRRPRKRYSTGNHGMDVEGDADFVDEKKQDNSPTELILNFPGPGSVPSEVNLNKIFRRFGPLMESETEVDRDTGRARVVFKKGSDAKVAFSSAGKFNIFGSVLVNYQINYSPTVAYKVLPLAITQAEEEAILAH